VKKWYNTGAIQRGEGTPYAGVNRYDCGTWVEVGILLGVERNMLGNLWKISKVDIFRVVLKMFGLKVYLRVFFLSDNPKH